jgi:nucleoside-diphosphate-sugar epimerase
VDLRSSGVDPEQSRRRPHPRGELDYEPTVSLDEGLADLAEE